MSNDVDMIVTRSVANYSELTDERNIPAPPAPPATLPMVSSVESELEKILKSLSGQERVVSEWHSTRPREDKSPSRD